MKQPVPARAINMVKNHEIQTLRSKKLAEGLYYFSSSEEHDVIYASM
jgi:hypothetical protein